MKKGRRPEPKQKTDEDHHHSRHTKGFTPLVCISLSLPLCISSRFSRLIILANKDEVMIIIIMIQVTRGNRAGRPQQMRSNMKNTRATRSDYFTDKKLWKVHNERKPQKHEISRDETAGDEGLSFDSSSASC